MNRTDRETLMNGLTEIDRLIDVLDLDSGVKQRSTEIYRNAAGDDDIIAGRGVNNVVAACVLLATRESNTVIEADEIAAHTDNHIRSKTIHSTTKLLRRELDLGFMLADPHKFVNAIQEELDAPDNHIERTHDAVDIVVNHGIASGNKASAIAASCFYLIGVFDTENGRHGRYTQKDVASAAGVSEVTIRNSYRDFTKVISDNPDIDITVETSA